MERLSVSQYIKDKFQSCFTCRKEGVLVSTGNYSTNAVVSFVLLEVLFCFVPWQNIVTKYQQIGWAEFVQPSQLARLRYLLSSRAATRSQWRGRALGKFPLNLFALPPTRKLQHSRATPASPAWVHVLSNFFFDPIQMGVVMFELIRKWWIMLRLQIFLTYFKIFLNISYVDVTCGQIKVKCNKVAFRKISENLRTRTF